MAHAIDKELHMYIDKLNADQKKSLLSIVRSFFTTNRVSEEQYNLEIDAAMLRMRNGDYLTQDDIDKDAAQW